MFKKFTDKGKKVLFLAQEEARRLGHNFVGTEQILLGLIGEETGLAARVLQSLGVRVTLKKVRIEVERIIGRGPGFCAVEIPHTPRTKKVLNFASEESNQFRHNYICTEHLLLGIIKEGDGKAVLILENLGFNLDSIEENLIKKIGKRNSKYNQQSDKNFNDDLSIDENEIIQKLKIIGINNIKQFKNQGVFYWWQKKYLEIYKSNKNDQNEKLIKLNNAREQLEILEKEYLINVLKKKRRDLIDIKVDDSDRRINLKSGTIFNINGKYVGELKNNMQHGQGTYIYSNGDKYIGEWKDNKRDGQGTFFYSNGDKYVGKWKDNKRYGQGTFFYSNGDKYVGKWKDDFKNGKGIKYFSNGNKYVGKWKDDLHKHGQGTYIYPNGDKYNW